MLQTSPHVISFQTILDFGVEQAFAGIPLIDDHLDCHMASLYAGRALLLAGPCPSRR